MMKQQTKVNVWTEEKGWRVAITKLDGTKKRSPEAGREACVCAAQLLRDHGIRAVIERIRKSVRK